MEHLHSILSPLGEISKTEGVVVYNGRMKSLVGKHFASHCSCFRGAALIRYEQVATLDMNRPYLRNTALLLDK